MLKKLVVGIVIASFCFLVDQSHGADWPLRINANGKYLEDQAGTPFLIVGDAGWELTTQISDSEAISYLNDRQAKGFNAVEVRVIGHSFQRNAPNDFYNNHPFTNGPSDWSVRNEAYWSRADVIVTAAKARDMVILMFPAYLGWTCGSQGWCADMLSQTNTAMSNYGAWIGNRYKDYGNVIWMTGGDADCSDYGNACARNNAVVSGIRSSDADAIFSAEPKPEQIGGIDSYVGLLNINALYTYGDQVAMVSRAYSSGAPFMFQEGYYENEHGTTLWVQQNQALVTYLGGGLIGHVFGSCPLWSFGSATGYCDSNSSPFNSWTNNLASSGSISMGAIGKLMRSRAWATFVPDYSNVVVTSAKGSGNSYHATARQSNGETVMVWCPNTSVVTVDMAKVGGTQAKVWWWNPDDDTAVLLGTYNTAGSRSFTPSSARKVLVLDNEASNLAAPGTTVYYSADGGQPSPPTNLQVVIQ